MESKDLVKTGSGLTPLVWVGIPCALIGVLLILALLESCCSRAMLENVNMRRLVAILLFACGISVAQPGSWRGLVIAEEERCAEYSPRDYRYSRVLENDIVDSLGGV